MARSKRSSGEMRRSNTTVHIELFVLDVHKLQGPSGVIGSPGKPGLGVQGPPGNTGSQERGLMTLGVQLLLNPYV